jgi:large subunit ribosomal protein L10
MEKFGRICKEYMVKEVAGHFSDYPDFFVTSFSKVSVEDMRNFRKDLKKASAVYMVIKNSTLKLALDKAGKDSNLINWTVPLALGNCGIVFSKKHSIQIARSLVGFRKKHEAFKINGGFIEGENVTTDTITFMASLPSREVLLGTVTATINSPISGFVGILGNLLRNLVGAIDAISKKKNE